MKIAVVHEWLTHYAGSERVLEQILLQYPQADLFAVADFLPPNDRAFLGGRTPRTTFLQRMPLARKHLRHYLGLMPLAIEGLDLRGYDAVISSSHAVAKGVLTGPDQFHLCYCHTPIRYASELQAQYLEQSGLHRGWKRAAARLLLHYMRLWDARTAHGVDQFIANSAHIARRIRKTYGRDAVVIHPPVAIDEFTPRRGRREGDYVAIARMVPYKRVDIIVDAFSRMPARRRLTVVGDGPLRGALERRAAANVTFAGHLPRERMRALLEDARALVFAAEEDFGITLAESLACATPVICYGRGGAREIVEDGVTGVSFDEQTPEAVCAAVARFESLEPELSREAMRASVERFHPRRFRRLLDEILRESIARRDAGRTAMTTGEEARRG